MHHTPELLLDLINAAYLEAMRFTDCGEEGQPPSSAALSLEGAGVAFNDCAAFVAQAHQQGLLERWFSTCRTVESFGHNFWFTRNRHGCGFWEIDDSALGKALTELAHRFPEVYTCLGEDGLIYLA